ncbi:hypothetical protein NCCNTM_55210 [Mycolicibacterium sp. NCC-Tsukiji]|nr:hypothetical protein NCCNTM_55210 [Mycolicibacterium sp. NCC-Tsukiji]
MLKYVDTELRNYGGSAVREGFMRQPEVRHLLALQVSWRLALAAAKGRTESPQAAAWAIAGRSSARRMVAVAALRAYTAAAEAKPPTDAY